LYGPIMRLPRLPFGSHRRGRKGRGALDPAAPRAGWFRERNDIPFRLISDPDLRLADSLGLPTFEFTGQLFYRRATLVAEHGEIVKVFYPVPTPEANAEAVLTRLRGRS
jgi:peroxiredoxin